MTNAEARSATRPFTGVIPPLITPLTSEGDVDHTSLKRHVDRLIQGGVTGLFVLGSSGEGPWLTTQQRVDVIATAVGAARSRVPVLAGVLDPGPVVVIEHVNRAAEAGADAVVVTTPYYFAAGHATQMRHFEAVATASPVPVMLYNIPEMTHNRLVPETAAELAAHPNIVGIKDSDGNWEHFEQFLAMRERFPGFAVFQGHERTAGKSLLAGADGVVPGLANLVPDLFVQMVRSAEDADRATVNALQGQIANLWELHNEGVWLTCLKYACFLNGIGSGFTTGHDESLSIAARESIARIVSAGIAIDIVA